MSVQHLCYDVSNFSVGFVAVDPLFGHRVEFRTKLILYGGFSEVWRGELDDNRKVAVKYLRMVRVGTTWGVLEFEQELRSITLTLKGLDHPNVLPFLGLRRDPDRGLAMVSPWMEHGNVVQYLKRYPNVDRLQLLLDVAEGLAYLHSRDIVHGDLRVNNILIDSDGHPRLSDFGLSLLFESFSVPIPTNYSFKAPELLHVESQMTSASDVYAWASCCFEIWAGRQPFHNMSDVQVILAVYNHEHPSRPPITDHATFHSRGLDDRMWALMEECWNADPDKRPTASALCDLLSTMHVASCAPTTHADGEDVLSKGRIQMSAVNVDIPGDGVVGYNQSTRQLSRM